MAVAVLASGRGSNLQALIDACDAPDFPARIALVLTNVPGANALARAEQAGIPTAVIDHRRFPSREAFEAAMRERINKTGAELVCLAGFMRLLTPGFVAAFSDRLINIHPSLLPAFPGLRVHGRVLESGARFTGCTVHFVSAETDAGPILIQAAVPVHPGDTAETLAARVLESEVRVYPQAVRWIGEGRVRINGAVVEIDGVAAPVAALINPLPEAATAGVRRQPTISISEKK
ncbi:MAG: phosphoribosylglycinamide formyltransferase [Alphaproteobacteria bacterium]|nr:phosphoribosylglycinamide formyltransferase [Alphaproteobacteria bacterium]